MITTAVFDTKPYDRKQLAVHFGTQRHRVAFLGVPPDEGNRGHRQGAQAVCVFVNDQLDRPCLEALAAQGVKLVALRCTGFNNVDLAAAKELNLAVTRVPVYSPYAVAEHAVGCC